MKSIGNINSNKIYNPNEIRNPPPPNLEETERDSEIEQYIRGEQRNFRSSIKRVFFFISFCSFSQIWVQEILWQVSVSGFKARSVTISVSCHFAPACFFTSTECSYNSCLIYCLTFIVQGTTIEAPSNVTSNVTNGAAASAFRGCLGWYQFIKGQQQQPKLFITSPIPTTCIFSRQLFYATTGW